MTITKIRRERVTLPAAGFAAPCPVCQREVEILNCAQAAAILEVAEEALQALLASGVIHGIEPLAGIRGVCKESLSGMAKYGPPARGEEGSSSSDTSQNTNRISGRRLLRVPDKILKGG